MSARVTLGDRELAHLADFAANVDPGCDPSEIGWWDHLANKLGRALSRIDGKHRRTLRTPTGRKHR